MENRTHVVFTRMDLSDDYSRHMAATMTSVMKNCSTPVTFHIIHEERISFRDAHAAENNMHKYQELVDSYPKCEIRYYNAHIPEIFYNNQKPEYSCIPTLVLYRFLIQELLPQDINRIISLGSDVIVNCDLYILINSMPNNYSLAGVIDQGFDAFVKHRGVKSFYKKIGFTPEKYINIDIMIMNLDKLRSTNILPEKAFEFIYKYPSVPMWEQDILNYLFQGDIYILSPRYNIIASFGEEHIDGILEIENKSDYILHYAGPDKPWDEYNGKYDMEYWYYLSLTPWGKDDRVYDYISTVFTSPDAVIHNMGRWICHYHSYRDVVKTLWKLTIPLWLKLVKYIANP